MAEEGGPTEVRSGSLSQANVVELARRAARGPLEGTPTDLLSPLAVLALTGDAGSAKRFERILLQMADDRWGIDGVGFYDFNCDAFVVKNIAECYRSLRSKGLIPSGACSRIERWLHRFASIRATGEIRHLEAFSSWNLRNQENTTGCLAEVASIIDEGPLAGKLPTEEIWTWVKRELVGWGLTWRDADDAWIYPSLWLWNAYTCARTLQPELLRSDNARRSFEWYLQLQPPGGAPLIFGETHCPEPTRVAAALFLGANLFQDGRMAFVARQLLNWGLEHDAVESSQLHRLYVHWPEHVEPEPPDPVVGMVQSPLPGRGWCLIGTPYGEVVKMMNPEFPGDPVHLFNYDEMYQERRPEMHARMRPDKFVFRSSWDADSLYAAVDLRSQALHDHPDALSLITLLWRRRPWVVETGYNPASKNRVRWKHNVPVFRRGLGDASYLKTWRTDTWREAEPADASFVTRGDIQCARARLRPEAFDYVRFGGSDFGVDRSFIFAPERMLVVVDVLTAQHDGEWTVGVLWHLRGQPEQVENGLVMTQGGDRFGVALASSADARLDLSERQPESPDNFYFDTPIRDLAYYTAGPFRAGEHHVFAAVFAPGGLLPITVTLENEGTHVLVGELGVFIPYEGGADTFEIG